MVQKQKHFQSCLEFQFLTMSKLSEWNCVRYILRAVMSQINGSRKMRDCWVQDEHSLDGADSTASSSRIYEKLWVEATKLPSCARS